MNIFHMMPVIAAMSLSFAAAQQTPTAPPKRQVWNFNDLKGWTLHSQDKNPDSQTSISNGCLKIFTKAGSADRKKAKTEAKIYTTGRYKWKTFIPKMEPGDRTSIGSWIYCDDQHEIDFEVGPGKADVRAKLGARPDDLVAYMTTQAHPFSSVPVLIKPGWHTFEIDLTDVNGKYKVQWFIDGKLKHTIMQTFGPEFAFYIYCSVENLGFIGDHPSTRDYTGLFDKVEYTWHK